MTRTKLTHWIGAAAVVLGSLVPATGLAQSGGTGTPRAPSGYSGTGATKGTTGGAAGAKSSPGSASGTQSKTYGPVLPASGKSSPAPVRRTAGEEPLREPGAAGTPGPATKAKAGGTKAALGTENNPVPVPGMIPRQPEWFPLAPNVQKWVDEVLAAWEKTSDEIVTFKCEFKKWEHDPAFGPKDPNTPYKYGKGIIQYAKPDKGMFKVESLVKYSPPAQAGGKPLWTKEIGEQWICDGRSIFEFDLRNSQLIQRILPKEMQGKAIADGPLPFLFGAKVATLKARYWIRPAPNTPEGREGEYWLEAIPRYGSDAVNFQKVSIIIDEKDFLPKALDVFAPNYDPRKNPAHTEYALEKRETTLKGDKKLLDPSVLIWWRKQFYEPDVPSGWKKIVQDMNVQPEGPQPVKGPAPGTATRPTGTKTKTK